MVEYSEPLALRSGLVLANRLVQAPMTVRLSFYNGIVTDEEIAHYARSAAGLGAVITGVANVSESGKGWPGELKISDDDAIPRLTALARAIQAQGAKAILQIFHAGRLSSRATLNGAQTVSASAVAAATEGAEVPRAMGEDEIGQVIADFAAAAKRAVAAGFDGVEIHGANGYLIQQFFSPHSNRRDDAWGGSLSRRMAFPLAVVDAVTAAVADATAGKPFAVGYRFSPLEATTPGIQLSDTLALLTELSRRPLDYLHVSLRQYDRRAKDSDFQAATELQYVHEALTGSGIPLIGVGGVRTRADVAGVLADAELVAIGQQLLVDPTFPLKLAQGRDADFVSKPFGAAIYDIDMPTPELDYLKRRYE